MNGIKKLIAIIVALIALIFVLSGCQSGNPADDVEARQIVNFMKLYADVDVGAGNNDDIFVDTVTGVMYFRDWDNGWIPIYNADGTLKICDGYRKFK